MLISLLSNMAFTLTFKELIPGVVLSQTRLCRGTHEEAALPGLLSAELCLYQP